MNSDKSSNYGTAAVRGVSRDEHENCLMDLTSKLQHMIPGANYIEPCRKKNNQTRDVIYPVH